MWPQHALITGIKMQLSHFIGNVPVWYYEINGTQFNYINHNLKPQDLQ